MGTETPHSIIAAAFAQLEEGGSVSLDSVARAVGLTKPGVMYHYPTKEALMLALVDSVLDRWESELTARLGVTSSRRARMIGSAPTWTGRFPESSAKQTWSR